MKLLTWGIVLAKGALTLSLCTLSIAAEAQTGNETAITFEADSGETTQAFQGSFQVPENRSNPDSRMIDLTYVRFPATTDTPGAPIVYLAGGPGGSGIGTAQWRRFPLFQAMRAYGDVIALDQRGTGQSQNGLETCESSQVIDYTSPLSDQDVRGVYRAAIEECWARWEAADFDPFGYTTLENVRDLRDLRLHLNAESLTLWGISYGSHMALAAMNEMPDEIERVVIASAEGLDQTIKLPIHGEAYLDRLQAAINADPAYAEEFPDVKGLITRVHAKLEAEPVSLRLTDERGEAQSVILQRAHMQTLISYSIGAPDRLFQLLRLYQAIDAGVYEPVQGVFGRVFNPGEPIRLRPMSTAMDIASGISAERLAVFEAQFSNTWVGPYLNFTTYAGLGAIDGLDLGDDFRADPMSDIPTLLISGNLDGRTFLDEQRQAVAGLSDLTHIVVENGGHNVFMVSPEVTARIEAFMADEAVREDPIHIDLPPL